MIRRIKPFIGTAVVAVIAVTLVQSIPPVSRAVTSLKNTLAGVFAKVGLK